MKFRNGQSATIVTAAALAATLASCDAGPSFDFELVPDPAKASEAQLLEQVGTIVFILDSEDGLYAPGEEATIGDLQIKDADGDPSDLELVATVPITEGRLPRVRIERGALPDVPIDVRVLGLPLSGDGAPVADGSLRGLRFGDDVESVKLPFDLRDGVLPPRVASVFPADGAELAGCAVPSILLVFSRPIEPGSILAEGAVTISPGATPAAVSIDDAGLVATISPAGLSGDGPSLSYGLKVASSVRDRDGHALDQSAAQPGAQPYDTSFTLRCGPPPLDPDMPCGGVFCAHLPQIACVNDRCVPIACSAECATGEVCDPARDSCVADCRSGGIVTACLDGTTCEADTGLCR